MPVLANPDVIFAGENACYQAGQNILQNFRLDIPVIFIYLFDLFDSYADIELAWVYAGELQ
jgi:ABC-type Fe3+-hydroxamate transport system substrate-binding protein